MLFVFCNIKITQEAKDRRGKSADLHKVFIAVHARSDSDSDVSWPLCKKASGGLVLRG